MSDENQSKSTLFQPGQSGNPNGRPKGTKTRVKYIVHEIMREKNCNPFDILADIAMDCLENAYQQKVKVSVNARLEAAIELASYLAPKLKSIELTGDTDAPVQFVINIKDATNSL